jgi:hypothetical protein
MPAKNAWWTRSYSGCELILSRADRTRWPAVKTLMNVVATNPAASSGEPAPPRERVIPLRKIDFLAGLIGEGRLSEDQVSGLRLFARMLGSVFHHEYYDELEQLRETYFHFNPDTPALAIKSEEADRIYLNFIDEFARVMERANFVEIPHAEIARAQKAHALVRVRIKAPLDEFRDVRIFKRGRHKERVSIPVWFGWRRKTIEVEVYDDVVMLVAARNESELRYRKGRARRHTRSPRIHPGNIILKYFRHIASGDLNALFPNVRVVMSLSDQLMLGVPALVGGIPIMLKLASTFTVLVVVAGFYLGLSGAVGDEDHKGAIAALGGLVALGAFMMQQWIRFQRQSLVHQKELTDNVYYRNLNNNAGIFDTIIGAAEDQEWKEAMLAYYGLLAAPAPLDRAALDRRIESLLTQTFQLSVDFEIDDALGKLARLGILHENEGRYSVLAPAVAMQQLDRVWDDFFGRDGAQG